MGVQIRIGKHTSVAVQGFSAFPVLKSRRGQRDSFQEGALEPATRPCRLAFQHGERWPGTAFLLRRFDQAFCIVRAKAPDEADGTAARSG